MRTNLGLTSLLILAVVSTRWSTLSKIDLEVVPDADGKFAKPQVNAAQSTTTMYTVSILVSTLESNYSMLNQYHLGLAPRLKKISTTS